MPQLRFSLIIASIVLCGPLAASGHEVRMSSISFQLPNSWHIESNSKDRTFATPSTQPDTPPIVMAELCVATAGHLCPASAPPDGCAAAKSSTQQWPHGLTENRWICPRTNTSAGGVMSAVSYFELENRKLRVAYIASDTDKAPSEFLDNLAKSLRFK